MRRDRGIAGVVGAVLLTLTACGSGLTATEDAARPSDPPAPSASQAPPAPATQAPPAQPTPAPTLDPASGLRQQSCREISSEVRTYLLGILVAMREPSVGPRERAGVALAFSRFSQAQLSMLTTTASADPEMARVLLRWSDANQDVAEYVSRTEPSGDGVLEFGPAHARVESARAAAEKLCGKPFV